MLQFSRKMRPLCQVLIQKCHFWYTIADLDIWSSIKTFKTNYCQRHDSLRVECFWHSNYLIKWSTRQLLVSTILFPKAVLFCSFCCLYFSLFPSCLSSTFSSTPTSATATININKIELASSGARVTLIKLTRRSSRCRRLHTPQCSADIVLDHLVVWLMGVVEEVDDVVGN